MKTTRVQAIVFRYSHTSGDPQILLLRLDAERGSEWQLLTGPIEDGEDEKGAIERLLSEETGLEEICAWHNLDYGFTFTHRETGRTEYESVYGIEVQSANERIRLTSSYADFRWMDPEEAFAELHWDTQKEGLRRLIMQLQESAE